MITQAQIIDKAKKLKELAERGIDGEKENAIRMYALYKTKHNLTDEQVIGHAYTENFKVNFSNASNDEFLKAMDEFLKSETFNQLVKMLVKIIR
jgi:CO dehydrogenase/acetyl-CoA synthase epsilon subunit